MSPKKMKNLLINTQKENTVSVTKMQIKVRIVLGSNSDEPSWTDNMKLVKTGRNYNSPTLLARA